jgi:hypothetical protein
VQGARPIRDLILDNYIVNAYEYHSIQQIGNTMYSLTVTCKGAAQVIGEFLGWHQLETLVNTQCDETVWNWFDTLIQRCHLMELDREHLVTVSPATGATVVYSIVSQ